MGIALLPRKKRVRDADGSVQHPTWLLSDLTLGEQGIVNKRGRKGRTWGTPTNDTRQVCGDERKNRRRQHLKHGMTFNQGSRSQQAVKLLRLHLLSASHNADTLL